MTPSPPRFTYHVIKIRASPPLANPHAREARYVKLCQLYGPP
jgi:hypothetical protein